MIQNHGILGKGRNHKEKWRIQPLANIQTWQCKKNSPTTFCSTQHRDLTWPGDFAETKLWWINWLPQWLSARSPELTEAAHLQLSALLPVVIFSEFIRTDGVQNPVSSLYTGWLRTDFHGLWYSTNSTAKKVSMDAWMVITANNVGKTY